ncbi:MAG: winged helix-turn-helix domain-containing protein [Blastocatellia bacterium]
MSSHISHLYEFGPFQLDITERVLRRAGEEVPLTPKALETLLVLVEHSGRILEKRKLMDQVWPDSFVEESNLTQQISTLRKALGDTSGAPQFIETVPKRGYRFIADVREVRQSEAGLLVEAETSTRVVIENLAPEETDTGWRRLVSGQFPVALVHRWPPLAAVPPVPLMMSGLMLCLLLVWMLAFRPASSVTGQPLNLNLTQLYSVKSYDSYNFSSARFSPDGKMIAFEAPGEDQNIWIMQPNGRLPVRITKDKWHDSSPVWSPDGDQIAFVSNRNHEIGIWVVPFLGSSPSLLKRLGDKTIETRNVTPVLKAWARDGRSIFYEWNSNFYRLDLTSKESEKLTSFNPDVENPQDFALSPDEQWIVWSQRNGNRFDLWRRALNGGTPLRVTDDEYSDRAPLWHPDGQRVIYTSIRDGRMQVCQAEVSTGLTQPLTAGDYNGSALDVSPDGIRILCHQQRYESDLVVASVETGEQRQITSDVGVEFWPTFSPDGQFIAYQSIPGERFYWDPRRGQLLTRTTSPDDTPRQLSSDAFDAEWSPDGSRLAFLRWTGRYYSLWTMPAAGGLEQPLVAEYVTYAGQTANPVMNLIQTADYSWSPDSHRIAYVARTDGAFNVWTIAADGSAPEKITSNASPSLRFQCPLWSPDGQQLAFVSDPGPQTEQQVVSLQVSRAGRTDLLFQTEAAMRVLGWTSDHELLVALLENAEQNRTRPAEIRLVGISLDDSGQRQVLTLPAAYFASFNLSPDKRNVSCVVAHDSRDQVLILSLTGEVVKKIAASPDDKVSCSGPVWSPDGKLICFSRQTNWSLLTLALNDK